MPAKRDAAEMRIRLPRDVREWIKAEAERNAVSMNAEVVRSCLERIRRARKAEGREGKATT